MERETIEKILNFLDAKEGKQIPGLWSLIQELENYPEGKQCRFMYDLYLQASRIKKLPNDLYVGGDLSLINCEDLKEFPDKLYVAGDLNLSNSGITELPKYLFVKGDLSLRNTPLLKKYTMDELYNAVKLGGGRIPSRIYT